MKTASIVLCALLVSLPLAADQLASRPAEEWIKTLDGATRVASLKIDDVVAAMKLKPGNTVADIGAGTGLLSVPVAKVVGPKGRVYAVEVDAGFFPAILKRAGDNGVTNVQTVLGEFADPRLPAKVDMAFFHDVLHHIENRGAYLKKMRTYLTVGGAITVVDFEAGKGPHAADSKLQVSREELTRLMSEIGLSPARDERLFDDKYVLTFAVKWLTEEK